MVFPLKVEGIWQFLLINLSATEIDDQIRVPIIFNKQPHHIIYGVSIKFFKA